MPPSRSIKVRAHIGRRPIGSWTGGTRLLGDSEAPPRCRVRNGPLPSSATPYPTRPLRYSSALESLGAWRTWLADPASTSSPTRSGPMRITAT
jgi:hypothetical protein